MCELFQNLCVFIFTSPLFYSLSSPPVLSCACLHRDRKVTLVHLDSLESPWVSFSITCIVFSMNLMLHIPIYTTHEEVQQSHNIQLEPRWCNVIIEWKNVQQLLISCLKILPAFVWCTWVMSLSVMSFSHCVHHRPKLMTNTSYFSLIYLKFSHHPLPGHLTPHSVRVCIFCACTKCACRGSEIRLACYEALVRTDIWPKRWAKAMLSRISERDAKQRENREKRNRNSPTRPTVTHSRPWHCSFGGSFPFVCSLDLPLVIKGSVSLSCSVLHWHCNSQLCFSSLLHFSVLLNLSKTERNLFNELFYLLLQVGGDMMTLSV